MRRISIKEMDRVRENGRRKDEEDEETEKKRKKKKGRRRKGEGERTAKQEVK